MTERLGASRRPGTPRTPGLAYASPSVSATFDIRVCDDARRTLLYAGVPESTLERAESHGAVDWQPLAVAMDDMFIVGHGKTTQLAFWAARAGKGMTALQVLERPGGAARVNDAARRWLARRG